VAQPTRTTRSGTVIIAVTARLLVSAKKWRAEHFSSEIKALVGALARHGSLIEFKIENVNGAGHPQPTFGACLVCGWTHDSNFTQFTEVGAEPIQLSGVLPDIVRVVHRAHEKGFSSLSSKDDQLVNLCGGYRHPCKAFDDLNQRAAYKRLFDTSRRGFIALRGAVGRNRNESETYPE
jgi:hypothetical protein